MDQISRLEVALGLPRVGLWCPICLLPSGYEADAFILTETGVSPAGTVRGCSESDDATHYPAKASAGA
jgi:hypothetical protein